MADYLIDGLTTDPDEILTGMIADFQAANPGWVPSPGDPLAQLMQIVSFRHAVRLDVDSQVLTAIFRYFGTLAGVLPLDATFARGTVTVTVKDTAGYTIPDGLRLDVAVTGNTSVRFLVDGATDIPVGDTSGPVSIVAETAGTAASGLTGSVSDVDGLDYITGVALVGSTAGGRDGETDSAYLARLGRRQRRTSDKIITAADAELALLDDVPGIGRVLILDNYIPAGHPGAEQFSVPGAFTAVIASADGSNVSGGVKTTAEDLIEAQRILAIDAYVIDPTRTNITAAYTATAYTGYDPAAVKTAADAAVTAYLSGTLWGAADTSSGGPSWEEDLTVRFSEIYAVLNNVPGINHVTDVKINGASNTNATITGPGALPTLTALTGVVT